MEFFICDFCRCSWNGWRQLPRFADSSQPGNQFRLFVEHGNGLDVPRVGRLSLGGRGRRRPTHQHHSNWLRRHRQQQPGRKSMSTVRHNQGSCIGDFLRLFCLSVCLPVLLHFSLSLYVSFLWEQFAHFISGWICRGMGVGARAPAHLRNIAR